MDETKFAHLRPRELAEEYAARVRHFILKCPEDLEQNSAYYQVVRFCGSFDWYGGTAARYQSPMDQYRVRTKVRRAELRSLIYFLPFVDVYGNDELEDERGRLIEDGQELVGIFDAVIKSCSP
jgi:hypothetical protein